LYIISSWEVNILAIGGGAGGAEGAVAPSLADKGAIGIKCPLHFADLVE